MDTAPFYRGYTREGWNVFNTWAELHEILLFCLGIKRMCPSDYSRDVFKKYDAKWPGLEAFFAQKCRTCIPIEEVDE